MESREKKRKEYHKKREKEKRLQRTANNAAARQNALPHEVQPQQQQSADVELEKMHEEIKTPEQLAQEKKQQELAEKAKQEREDSAVCDRMGTIWSYVSFHNENSDAKVKAKWNACSAQEKYEIINATFPDETKAFSIIIRAMIGGQYSREAFADYLKVCRTNKAEMRPMFKKDEAKMSEYKAEGKRKWCENNAKYLTQLETIYARRGSKNYKFDRVKVRQFYESRLALLTEEMKQLDDMKDKAEKDFLRMQMDFIRNTVKQVAEIDEKMLTTMSDDALEALRKLLDSVREAYTTIREAEEDKAAENAETKLSTAEKHKKIRNQKRRQRRHRQNQQDQHTDNAQNQPDQHIDNAQNQPDQHTDNAQNQQNQQDQQD